MKKISPERIEYIVEHAFDEELVLDHKPTQWELELYVYEKVLQAQLDADREVVKELLQWIEDTGIVIMLSPRKRKEYQALKQKLLEEEKDEKF